MIKLEGWEEIALVTREQMESIIQYAVMPIYSSKNSANDIRTMYHSEYIDLIAINLSLYIVLNV